MVRYWIPYYYKEFACAGGTCEDTCCGGWRIAIDPDTMARYRQTPGAFGRRLRMAVDREHHCFHLRNRRCVMLDQDGLCRIQKKLGAEGLCKDCRRYPRHMEDYGDVREFSLSLSCPEAARVILRDENQGACREVYRDVAGEREPQLFWLEEARQTLICLIKDRSVDWIQRLAMVLAYTYDLQRRVGDHSPAEIKMSVDELTARYLKPGAAARFAEKLAPYRGRGRERRIRINGWLRQCGTLEPVQAHWAERMDCVCSYLYHRLTEAEYMENERQFACQAVHCEQEWENLALYFLQTYFLGAVYDGDVFGKGQMVVYSCLVIREWCLMRYCRTGRFSQEDLVAAAYRYSREVENSDANLELLETMFEDNPLYSLPSMLTVLCGGE